MADCFTLAFRYIKTWRSQLADCFTLAFRYIKTWQSQLACSLHRRTKFACVVKQMTCYTKSSSSFFLKLAISSSDSSQRLNKSVALVTVLRENMHPVYSKIFLSTTRQITRSANQNECSAICRKLQWTSLRWQVTGDTHTEVTGMHNGFIIPSCEGYWSMWQQISVYLQHFKRQ